MPNSFPRHRCAHRPSILRLQPILMISGLILSVAGCRMADHQPEVAEYHSAELLPATTFTVAAKKEIPVFDVTHYPEKGIKPSVASWQPRANDDTNDDRMESFAVVFPTVDSNRLDAPTAPSAVIDATPVEAPVPADQGPARLTEDDILAHLQLLGATIQRDENDNVNGVDLAYASVDDDAIDLVANLADLQRLDLTATDITDRGPAKLITLTKLQTLTLRGTSIGDEGLAQVAQVSGLELLDLSKTAITNDGLAHLTELKRLKYLMLAGTAISDEGLAHLHELENLAGLSLTGTGVTGAGTNRLSKALPRCRIIVKFTDEQSKVDVPLETQEESSPQRAIATTDTTAPKSLLRRSPTADFAAANPEQALKLAEQASSTGRWHDAVEILQAAVKSRPEDTLLQFRLGIALARTGDSDAALPYLRTTVGESAAYYNLGLITYEQMLQTSEQYFTKALELNSEFPSARTWLADVHGHRNGFNITDGPVQFAGSSKFPVGQDAAVVIEDDSDRTAGPRFHMGDLRGNNLHETESR